MAGGRPTVVFLWLKSAGQGRAPASVTCTGTLRCPSSEVQLLAMGDSRSWSFSRCIALKEHPVLDIAASCAGCVNCLPWCHAKAATSRDHRRRRCGHGVRVEPCQKFRCRERDCSRAEPASWRRGVDDRPRDRRLQAAHQHRCARCPSTASLFKPLPFSPFKFVL